jgi:hypothetical protein
LDNHVRTLIFDIEGTVLDRNTAMIEALGRTGANTKGSDVDRQSFAQECRANFLELGGAVLRGDGPWLTF